MDREELRDSVFQRLQQLTLAEQLTIDRPADVDAVQRRAAQNQKLVAQIAQELRQLLQEEA